jgi:hypothetical protein
LREISVRDLLGLVKVRGLIPRERNKKSRRRMRLGREISKETHIIV